MWKIGDCVYLRAGSPKMVVSAVRPDTESVTVTWFESSDGSPGFMSDWNLPDACLVAAAPYSGPSSM